MNPDPDIPTTVLSAPEGGQGTVVPEGSPTTGAPAPRAGGGLPFDPWRLVAVLLRRWPVPLVAGALLAGLAGLAGHLRLTSEYKAGAQLMRQEPSASFRASEQGDAFKPRQMSVTTLVNFMKSSAVMQRVAEAAKMPARNIAAGLTITPERNTDLITLSFRTTRSSETAVRVLNAFGNEVVRLTRDMQAQESADVNRLLQQQLTKADEDLRVMNRELLDFARQADLISVDKEIDAYLRSLGELDMRLETARIDFETLDLRIRALERELSAHNPLAERVQAAREKIDELLQIYTEANPVVQEQRAALTELEARLQAQSTSTNAIVPPRPGEVGLVVGFYTELLGLRTQKQVTAAQIEKLKATRATVDQKLRGLPEKGMQLARLKARQQSLENSQALLTSRQREAQIYEENPPGYYRFFEAKTDEVEVTGRSKKLVVFAAAGGGLGAFLAIALLCLIESIDDRIKTAADLKRATRLPLLASLPDLDTLDAVGQTGWAFRTWLALQSRFSTGPAGRMVVGFAAAQRQEGCSTWLELLGRAAAQRDLPVVALTNRPPTNGEPRPLEVALADPTSLKITRGKVQWLVIAPDWHWNSARRAAWKSALQTWGNTEGLVVLAELGSLEDPEALLFAEVLPQLLWLSGCGTARERQVREALQTCLDAGCRFVGAVFNRETKLFRRP